MLLIGGDFFLRTYYIRTRFVPVKELRQRARYDLVLVHDKTACHTSFLTPVAFIHSLWSVVVNLQVRIVGMFTYRNVLLVYKFLIHTMNSSLIWRGQSGSSSPQAHAPSALGSVNTSCVLKK